MPITAIVIGAGARGSTYATFAQEFPDRLKIVGVADKNKFFKEKLAKEHNVSSKYVCDDWCDILAMEKFADCVFICTPDQLHKGPAITAAQKGYNILLEKPMATTYQDCKDIYEACKKSGSLLAVCHVLRYLPISRKIKQLIDSGVIGKVINIQHLEPIGYWHFPHSYVRGPWRNEAGSAFSLLTKSCHDIDLITYWLGQDECVAVSSFGSLEHFRKENKPPGAASRCVDCAVEQECAFSAKKFYLKLANVTKVSSFISKLVDVPDVENIMEALRSGPYGRCAYESDNDVVDNQVVNFQFAKGSTVSFTMIAFTEKVCERQVRIFGTKGELSCDFSQQKIDHFDFLSQRKTFYDASEYQNVSHQKSRLLDHGGADFYLMDNFLSALETGDHSKILTGIEATLYSHYLTFVAEQSRRENKVLDPRVL